MTHTPGPWTFEIEDDAHPFGIVRIYGMDGNVHIGYLNKQPRQMDRILADANLISTAPNLLAALKAHQAVGEHVATCPQCGDSAPCYTYNGLARKADELTRAVLARVEETQ